MSDGRTRPCFVNGEKGSVTLQGDEIHIVVGKKLIVIKGSEINEFMSHGSHTVAITNKSSSSWSVRFLDGKSVTSFKNGLIKILENCQSSSEEGSDTTSEFSESEDKVDTENANKTNTSVDEERSSESYETTSEGTGEWVSTEGSRSSESEYSYYSTSESEGELPVKKVVEKKALTVGTPSLAAGSNQLRTKNTQVVTPTNQGVSRPKKVQIVTPKSQSVVRENLVSNTFVPTKSAVKVGKFEKKSRRVDPIFKPMNGKKKGKRRSALSCCSCCRCIACMCAVCVCVCVVVVLVIVISLVVYYTFFFQPMSPTDDPDEIPIPPGPDPFDDFEFAVKFSEPLYVADKSSSIHVDAIVVILRSNSNVNHSFTWKCSDGHEQEGGDSLQHSFAVNTNPKANKSIWIEVIRKTELNSSAVFRDVPYASVVYLEGISYLSEEVESCIEMNRTHFYLSLFDSTVRDIEGVFVTEKCGGITGTCAYVDNEGLFLCVNTSSEEIWIFKSIIIMNCVMPKAVESARRKSEAINWSTLTVNGFQVSDASLEIDIDPYFSFEPDIIWNYEGYFSYYFMHWTVEVLEWMFIGSNLDAGIGVSVDAHLGITYGHSWDIFVPRRGTARIPQIPILKYFVELKGESGIGFTVQGESKFEFSVGLRGNIDFGFHYDKLTGNFTAFGEVPTGVFKINASDTLCELNIKQEVFKPSLSVGVMVDLVNVDFLTVDLLKIGVEFPIVAEAKYSANDGNGCECQEENGFVNCKRGFNNSVNFKTTLAATLLNFKIGDVEVTALKGEMPLFDDYPLWEEPTICLNHYIDGCEDCVSGKEKAYDACAYDYMCCESGQKACNGMCCLTDEVCCGVCNEEFMWSRMCCDQEHMCPEDCCSSDVCPIGGSYCNGDYCNEACGTFETCLSTGCCPNFNIIDGECCDGDSFVMNGVCCAPEDVDVTAECCTGIGKITNNGTVCCKGKVDEWEAIVCGGKCCVTEYENTQRRCCNTAINSCMNDDECCPLCPSGKICLRLQGLAGCCPPDSGGWCGATPEGVPHCCASGERCCSVGATGNYAPGLCCPEPDFDIEPYAQTCCPRISRPTRCCVDL